MATENQQALLNEIGLKYKDLGYGKGQIVKNSVGEEVPSNVELSDNYYPALAQRVVSQQVNDGVRVFALENGVFLREDWVNGIKEYISNGIISLNDYDKDITISDFNPADPSQSVIKYSIDITKYGVLKFTRNQILQAFTNPANLESFVNQLVKRISDTWRYFLQNEKAKILAGTSDAYLAIVWDEIIDTTGMSTLDIVELAVHMTESMNTASPEWLALTDDTFIYSASENNISYVMRPFLKAAIARESSSLFNYNQLITDKLRNAPTIDLLKAGIADTGIRMWMLDNQALRIGYQVENLEWNFKVPKAQVELEVHNWLGFASIPTLYKSVWTDAVEPELAKLKKIKGYNKKFKTKVTKGKELLEKLKSNKAK